MTNADRPLKELFSEAEAAAKPLPDGRGSDSVQSRDREELFLG